MCGIFAILNFQNKKYIRKIAIAQSKKMKHRGPDWSGYKISNNNIFCHERLSIIDVFHGAQPITSKNGKIILAVNGEIYNYKELKQEFDPETFTTDSDCEVLIQLYQKYGTHFLDNVKILGMFAFILYDSEMDTYIIGRDHLGIIPLYMGYGEANEVYIASEMKSLVELTKNIMVFPPAQFCVNGSNFYTFYQPHWKTQMVNIPFNTNELNTVLTNAVKSHLIADVDVGLLISGGLDSSLIASIAQKNSKKQLKSFCIGLEGSPDIAAAEKVADFIGTKHYSFYYTVQEGIDAIEDVIYHTESCDVTTIRASTPMYLLARRIRALGIKCVLTGEVSDEISGSYAYFKYAPDSKEFYEETVRKVNDLYRYDLLRANKSMMAWSIETRVPFGDRDVVDYIMNLNPEFKMWSDIRMEKHYLRRAFSDGYLPEDMLWRKKEQFSDGVGYNWVDSLKEYAEQHVTDEQFNNAKTIFPTSTPTTKEAFLYREIFHKYFPHKSCIETLPYEKSVACSTGTAMKWFAKNQIVDPSGRAVKGHSCSLK